MPWDTAVVVPRDAAAVACRASAGPQPQLRHSDYDMHTNCIAVAAAAATAACCTETLKR